MQLKSVLLTIRPSFLVLTPACVFLSLSLSLAAHSSINLLMFFLVLVGATCAHISVNTLNEYHDFKSGLDLQTIRTPFSGGSGALPNKPELASVTLIIGIVALMITIAIGIYFIINVGSQLLSVGIAGVALIVTYTQWINRLPLLCLVAPGLGFGTLMVIGTYIVLTGEHAQIVWLVSFVPFFLINNLLLLNQYPDITADASVGRNTFPIAYGLKKSNLVYAIFMISAYALILFLVIRGDLPKMSLLVFISMLFSLFSLFGAMKHSSAIGEYPIYLAANVVAAISAPLLLGISIIYG
ncbi:MAG: prenyltransferase [Colwellia sp.]|nr:prenyltransferase [Colwellia sp.]MCW8864600.1 prenyltransferase [Colwellia sp.]MCW9081534.1 prenyltransferase [Colwellia sp.]